MHQGRRFFRGSEFSRLLLLALLAAGGWVFFVLSGRDDQAPPDAPPPHARAADPLPPPESGPEFEGILDKTPMSPRDNPAYAALLERVRATPPAKLRSVGRRDVLFSQLLENPARYRGLPIHLEGTMLRVLRQEASGSKLFPRGEYFEAYLISPDSQNYPIILVFEEAPPDLPVGDNLRVHAAFDGYFLKLVAYQAGDTMRFAPALIGRLGWAELPEPAQPDRASDRGWGWLILLLCGALLIRFLFSIRRLRRSSPRRAGTSSGLYRNEIEPEELSDWLQSPEPEADEDSLR